MGSKRTNPRAERTAALILGLLLGTIFIFLVGHNNAPIQQEDAIPITATFKELETTQSKRVRIGKVRASTPRHFYLYFTDHERLELDVYVLNNDIRDALDALTPGTTLDMLLHPHSGAIVSIAAQGETLLDFDHAMTRLTLERKGFLYLGLFLYAGAVWGAWGLRPKKRRR